MFRNLSILKSVQVSFIFHISTQCALDMLHFSGLNFVSAKAQDSMYLSIVSGTLYDWREAVILGSQESQSEEVRNTFNQCYIILINSGFKFVWKDYKRIKLKDGTLLLKA